MSREAMRLALEALQAPVETVNTVAMKSKASAALCEALAQQDSVAWEHHAKKLTQWLHCMSYNDSYFGEPVGLVKQVTGELNRLIGTSPPARKPLTDQVLVPLNVLEAAESSLGSFCSDEGWSGKDIQNMDNLSAYIAKHKAAHGIKDES